MTPLYPQKLALTSVGIVRVRTKATEFSFSTDGIQLRVSALYVGHLQVEIQLTDQLYKMCGVFVWGEGGETISRCFNSGYRDLGLLQVDFSLVYVHMSSGLLFLC